MKKYIPLLIVSATLLAIALVSGCASKQPIMSPDVIPNMDLSWCLRNHACYKGLGVVPYQDEYILEIAPRKEEKISRIAFGTCHRTPAYYPDEPEVKWGYLDFLRRWWKGKGSDVQAKGFTWTFSPTRGMRNRGEGSGTCDLYIYVLDQESEDHSFGVMRMENPNFQLSAHVFCDGDGGKSYKGVSGCAGKAGTRQWVKFPDEVRVTYPSPTGPYSSCPRLEELENNMFQLDLHVGKCPYLFTTKDGRLHNMVTYGYQGLKFMFR